MPTPTIVIVPAACQTPAHYQPLASALQTANLTVAVIPLPSVGTSPALKSFDEDVSAIHKVVRSLVDDDFEVVVLMHSYGGLPGSAAMKGLGVKERVEEGKKGGVSRLVYVASYALRVGEGLPSKGDLETMRSLGEAFDEKAGTLLVGKDVALHAMFHDIPTSEAEHWASLLETHSVGAMWSEQTYAAFKDIPSTYVVCELDRFVPVEQQEGMIRSAKEVEPSAFDVVERLQSGHEPNLSRIGEMVGVVERAVGKGSS